MPGGALAPISEQARDFLRAAKSANTLRAYRSDWEDFSTWCNSHGVPFLPAEADTVALYVSDLASTAKPSTIGRRLSAISVAHQAAGHSSPTRSLLVRDTFAGIRRTVGTAQDKKSPVRVNHLREAAGQLGDSLQEVRDKAVVLFGYAGAFRRSELVALNVEDVKFSIEGAKVTLRRSKTDQEGKGTVKGIGYGSKSSTCPVRALQAWIGAAGITSGPIFRAVNKGGKVSPTRLSDKAVSLIVKRIAPKLGLDSEDVSGHSLRAGFVTDQYAKGTAETVIMHHTGHKSRTVMAGYRREADLFAVNYTAVAGL
jgi:integrase